MLLLVGRSCKTFTPAPSAMGGQQGFTLIEIMVVIVILSIFAGMMSLSVGVVKIVETRHFMSV